MSNQENDKLLDDFQETIEEWAAVQYKLLKLISRVADVAGQTGDNYRRLEEVGYNLQKIQDELRDYAKKRTKKITTTFPDIQELKDEKLRGEISRGEAIEL